MVSNQSQIGRGFTTPNTEDFGGIFNDALNKQLATEERARLSKEREAKRISELQDRFGIDENLFVLPNTEFRTVNDATSEIIGLYRDKFHEVFNELQKNPSDTSLLKRRGNIINSVKRLKLTHDTIKKRGEELLEMVEKDEISGLDEDRWREIMESTSNGEMSIKLDDKDQIEILFYKKDKDGVSKLNDVLSFDELINKSTLRKKINITSQLDEFAKSIGAFEDSKVNGGFIKTESVFGEKQESFTNEFITSLLGTDDLSLEKNDILGDLLNQITGGESKKDKNFSEEDRELVKDWLINQVKGRFNEKVTLKERPKSSGSASSVKTPSVSDISLSMNRDLPERDSDNNFIFTLKKNLSIEPNSDKKINTIKLNPDGRITIEGTDKEKVNQVPEGATIEEIAAQEGVSFFDIIKISNSDKTVTFFKTKPFTETNTTVINRIANILGLQDENGLRGLLNKNLVDRVGEETANQLLSTSSPNNQESSGEPTEEELRQAEEFINNVTGNNNN